MDVTYYVALPFVTADDGVAAGEAVECLSANAAVMRTEALSRMPDCAEKLIRKFGDVPDDLSSL
jgi:hypothetical protein